MSNTTPQTTDMQHLVEKMQAGDLKACNELFRRVCKRLEKLARKMFRSFPQLRYWEESDDVLQNTLVRLMRSLKQLKPDSMSAFYALAAKEIRRELIDLARHYFGPEGEAANRQHFSPSAAIDPVRIEPAEPADTDLDKWIRFHEEVEKLPAAQREVVSLVFYHGWNQSQVAHLFGVDVRTIRRHWHKALLQLRQQVKGNVIPS